jgi:hypothetical protein
MPLEVHTIVENPSDFHGSTREHPIQEVDHEIKEFPRSLRAAGKRSGAAEWGLPQTSAREGRIAAPPHVELSGQREAASIPAGLELN